MPCVQVYAQGIVYAGDGSLQGTVLLLGDLGCRVEGVCEALLQVLNPHAVFPEDGRGEERRRGLGYIRIHIT